MKVIVINNLYAPFGRGGAEKIAEKIVSGLTAEGHDVFVIATRPAAKGAAEKVEGVKGYFIPSVFFDLGKRSIVYRFFYHIFDSFNFLKAVKIWKILKQERPDLVITNNLKGLGLLLPVVIRKLKIRHIHILHDIQLLHPSGLMLWGKEKVIRSPHALAYQFINRLLFGSPDILISPSQWLLDLHISKGFFGDSKKKVLPNYFKKTTVGSAVSDARGDAFIFLYVGQLEAHKGVRFLVETFLNFLNYHPSSRLLVVGDGSDANAIRKMIAGRLEITLLGHKDSDGVAQLMSLSNCLVVPSLCYENSPTVIYEAAAHCLPVLASDIGGISELIRHIGGWLFRPGDRNDLLVKLEAVMLSNEEIQIVREKEADFSGDDYVETLLALAEG
jgi:glycosyltransferase involved in cell wall biosynthesis